MSDDSGRSERRADREGGVPVLIVRGELDAYSAPTLDAAIEALPSTVSIASCSTWRRWGSSTPPDCGR